MQVFAFLLNVIDDITSADYRAALNTALDTIERVWQVFAAAVVIIADIVGIIWHNGGKDAATNLVLWWDDSFIPGVENAITAVYLAGVRSRIVWERINSPLFIAL